MVQMVSWQIVTGTILLPWLGFVIGMICSLILRQPVPDLIAITLESGAKNTGLTMFLVLFALEQPAADLAMIIPIAVSITTPIPLIVYGISKKIYECCTKKKTESIAEESTAIEPIKGDTEDKTVGPAKVENGSAVTEPNNTESESTPIAPFKIEDETPAKEPAKNENGSAVIVPFKVDSKSEATTTSADNADKEETGIEPSTVESAVTAAESEKVESESSVKETENKEVVAADPVHVNKPDNELTATEAPTRTTESAVVEPVQTVTVSERL